MKLNKFKDAELEELHFEISMELAHLARTTSEINSKIDELTNTIEDVELELESREAKKNNRIN